MMKMKSKKTLKPVKNVCSVCRHGWWSSKHALVCEACLFAKSGRHGRIGRYVWSAVSETGWVLYEVSPCSGGDHDVGEIRGSASAATSPPNWKEFVIGTDVIAVTAIDEAGSLRDAAEALVTRRREQRGDA